MIEGHLPPNTGHARTYRKGTPWPHTGRKIFGIVLDGSAWVYEYPEGREMVSEQINRGDVLFYTSWAYVLFREPAKVLEIQEEVLYRHPEVVRAVLNRLSEQRDRVRNALVENSSLMIPDRVEKILKRMAKNKGTRELKLSRTDLAKVACCTREATWKALRTLHLRGKLIWTHGIRTILLLEN